MALNDAAPRDAWLLGSVLNGASLTGAVLVGARCNSASLIKATLLDADLSGANLSGANLAEADLTAANLRGANLTHTILVDTCLERASLSNCRVYGISAWGVKLDGAVQSDLIITPKNQPTVTIDNLEVSQFIYLLLNNEKIRQVIDTITTKVVLILGRFTPERKAVLEAIRAELRKRDYVPVMFDFDKPANRDLTETVRILAHLARFIIVDITEPRSVPHELASVVADLAVPVQPLLLAGSTGEYAMLQDLRRRYHWVPETLRYKGLEDLIASLPLVIALAEAKAKELTQQRSI